MKKIATALALLAALAAPAHAEFQSGNNLMSMLTGSNMDAVAGMSYIQGAADVVHGVLYCPPKGVTTQQIADMVLQELRDRPSERHYSADSFVTPVLRRTWPCAAKPTSGRAL